MILSLLLALPLVATAQDDDYVPGGSWESTMLESRERYRARDDRASVELGPWWATAPMPVKSFATPGFPEAGIDLDAVDDTGKPRWRKRGKWTDGRTHALPSIGGAASYLYRTIEAPAAMTVTAGFGSDDGMAVWLNGEQLFTKNVARGLGAAQDHVDLPLVEGRNELLFKIHNQSGSHGFYFSLGENPLQPLWNRIADEFPVEAGWFARDLPRGEHLAWFEEGEDLAVTRRAIRRAVESIDGPEDWERDRPGISAAAIRLSPRFGAAAWKLANYRGWCLSRDIVEEHDRIDIAALRRAMEDLTATYPSGYPEGPIFLEQLDRLTPELATAREMAVAGDLDQAPFILWELEDLRRKALLANPLLDFDRLVAIKRPASSPKLGLPQNWQGNCSLPRSGFDDELVTIDWRAGAESMTTLFTPETGRMIADVDLHFDADRMLFSMLGSHDRWQIFELGADGTGLRQVTPGLDDDVDNYDACYLPDGRIIFDSTSVFQGIPCVTGSDRVANLFVMDASGENVRRLCFDQDHDWCPTVLNNGRVMYTRWEYSDTPHYFTRVLFHMNPDGTGQMEHYGSNSFWPNSLFYARPIPDHPTKFVAVVGGHHGVPRMGELVVFDPAQGRFEADGVVQRIPGYGEEVEPIIVDELVNQSWPRFLHPWPLSDKYFLVSCQPTAADPWGIYLVDVFDNIVPLAELPGSALFEPIPLRARPTPPSIPDRIDPESTEATVYLADVYAGPGLTGVPRGTVKNLRVYSLHYAYPLMGGHKHVGVESAWDVRRVLGTVPVEEDGSASFTIPANTPIAVQPLDEEGRAVQLMRSWFTAMPGEVLSCVGCHESQNSSPSVRPTVAARRAPSDIAPWFGEARGFSFKREVQPVLDRRCVACHAGSEEVPLDLRRTEENGWGNFTPSYLALHPFVRRPGPESDYHVLVPLEYHANTSELVQMLEKGHHGVELDDEEWSRLVTWIDLNVPDHGTWSEHRDIAGNFCARRAEMDAEYAGLTTDQEAIPAAMTKAIEPIRPAPIVEPALGDTMCDGWPFDATEAGKRQSAATLPGERVLDLGDGVKMELTLVPAGEFLLGGADGFADELPRTRTAIASPFYLGKYEVTCAQYARFDADHHNGYLDQHHKDHTTPGYPADGDDDPVIRISWEDAMAFCAWLTEETGVACTLPTEAEWEWACRAGSDTPLAWGDLDADFSPFANLADASMKRLAVTGVNPQPIPNPNRHEDFLPKDARYDDGERLMTNVGRYAPNAWGLHDMHGNVAEWTRSRYASYPWRNDGRNEASGGGERVVRGGSWCDRPKLARSSARLAYRPYQGVHNVGFRVLIAVESSELAGR